MGKTWGLRSSPRLDALVNFFLAFFFLHFFLIRKEVRMNLITSIFSILCLVSLVAGIPANGYNRQRDFAGEEKDEANREADGEEPESAQPESAEPPCIQKGKSCTHWAWAGECCEDAPVCRSNPRPWYEIGRPSPYAPKFCRES